MLSEYNDKSVVLHGDGRCDSPGKSAKYCTYSLMDSENDKILYVETADKREVGLKSPNMEREAFKRSMQYLTNKKGIKIQQQSYLLQVHLESCTCMYFFYFIVADDYTDVHHSLDVWHKAKKLKKGLSEVRHNLDMVW